MYIRNLYISIMIIYYTVTNTTNMTGLQEILIFSIQHSLRAARFEYNT